jgi:hypothetical protein
MKAASIQQIKQELISKPPAQLLETCLRIAKFKKENKELLSYLLFYENDERSFIDDVKQEMDDLFDEINRSHLYYAKKSLRKILRIINKYCRYSPHTETEIELRLHFCSTLKNSGISLRKEKQIFKMYTGQLLKIKKSISSLHEDLQYDFEKMLAEVEE